MKSAKVILCAALVLALCAGSFFLGRASAPAETGRTFYAVIEEISQTEMYVSGLEVNDINHRGQFRICADDAMEITWRGTEISWSELAPGDTVSVTYTGEVLEISPGVIQGTVHIDLLDDEK